MHNLLSENIKHVYCTDKLSKSNSFVNSSNIYAARANSNAAMINMFKYIKISLTLFSTGNSTWNVNELMPITIILLTDIPISTKDVTMSQNNLNSLILFYSENLKAVVSALLHKNICMSPIGNFLEKRFICVKIR